jgi:hypothetical protein
MTTVGNGLRKAGKLIGFSGWEAKGGMHISSGADEGL